MILPSFSSIDWSFVAEAVWDWEPVPPSDEAAASIQAEPTSDGASSPSVRLVFKGYEWRPTASWECLANPAWEQRADSGRDDALDRARSNERNRAAGPARAPMALTAPVAPSEDGQEKP